VPCNASSSNGNGNGRGRAKNPSALFPIEIQIRTQEMERLAQYGIAVESWSCADYARGVGASQQQLERAGPGNAISNGENVDSSPSRDEGGGYGAILRKFPFGLGFLSSGGSSDGDAKESSTAPNGSVPGNAQPFSSSSAFRSPSSVNRATSQIGAGSSSGSTAANSITGEKLDPQTMSRRINWLNSIRQWQEEFVGTLTAQEFVACVTDDLLGQGVFVFTPSGQVMRLPKGSTVIDFAYHIHTDIGNTMVAARVNGKVVNADHELANAEVVEVITYKGPVNATIIKRHQQWLGASRTKTARHKIAKFLREHAALSASAGLMAPDDSALGIVQRGFADVSRAIDSQVVWLLAHCDDRQGLLADIANVIAGSRHNIRSYSGSIDREAAVFVMEYELEGPSESLEGLCSELNKISSVRGWAVGCALPSAGRPARRI